MSENQKIQNLRQFLRRLLMRFERVLYAVPISSASEDKWGTEIDTTLPEAGMTLYKSLGQ